MDNMEITSLNLSVEVFYNNSRGLARKAMLPLEISPREYREISSNKGRWNKWIGDKIMDIITACLEVAGEEYRGIARPEKPGKTEKTGKTGVEQLVEQLDARAEEAVAKPPPPQSLGDGE